MRIGSLASLYFLALSACAAPTPQQGGWVSLHPAITETLFEFGVGHRLTGRSDYCTYPKEAKSLTTYGTALTPEIEKLANLKPDGVLLDASFGTKVDAIARVAPVTRLSWLTLADVTESTLKLGELMGEPEQANQWVQKYKAHLGDTPAEDAPTALLVLGTGEMTHETLWYVKPDSLHGAALASAGFRNVVPEGLSGPPKMSIEQLIAYDPNYLLVATTDEDKDAVVTSLSKIKPLQAVQNDKIRVLAGERTMSIGPSIITLTQQLTAIREAK